MDFNDDDEEEICFYTPKYGINYLDSIQFDDHALFGSRYLQYKPERIEFWTDDLGRITGIKTWFRSIVDSNIVNSGDNKGSDSKNRHIFEINPNEYLSKCRIWKLDNGPITQIKLETNKGSDFQIGINEGDEVPIEEFNHGNKIIVSFMGSYKKSIESFGFHIVEKKEYMKVMFTGYFELKKILKNEKKKETFIQKLNSKEYSYEDEAIIRTCLLPTSPFTQVMKYCVF